MDNIVIVVVQCFEELLVHQRNKNPEFYGLGAGGKIEKNESSKLAAIRKLEEELGIVSDVEPLFNFINSKSHPYTVYVYRTPDYTKKIKFTPCREFKLACWISVPEMDKLVSEGKLLSDTRTTYEIIRREFI